MRVRAGVRVGGGRRGGGEGPPIHEALALKGEDARGRAGDRVDEGGNNHLWGTGGRGVHGARYVARRVDGRGEVLVEEAGNDVLNGGVEILGFAHSERRVGGGVGSTPREAASSWVSLVASS